MISSIVWLERGSPDCTSPAYFIQGPSPAGGSASRSARRTNSATEMPSARASFLARAYSRGSRLTCVRIMLSLPHWHDNTPVHLFQLRDPDLHCPQARLRPRVHQILSVDAG